MSSSTAAASGKSSGIDFLCSAIPDLDEAGHERNEADGDEASSAIPDGQQDDALDQDAPGEECEETEEEDQQLTALTMPLPRLTVSRYVRCECENCVQLPDTSYFAELARTREQRISMKAARSASTAACRAANSLKSSQSMTAGEATSPLASTASTTDDTPSSAAASPVESSKSKSKSKSKTKPSGPSHLNCQRLLTFSLPPRRPYRTIMEKKVDYMTPLFRRISGMDFDSLFGTDGGIPQPQVVKTSSTEAQGANRGSSDWVAEVVVIGNSLPSSFKSYIDSLRCQQLLDCKGVEYFHVDISLDVGDEFPDAALVRHWRELNWVLRDKRKPSKNDVLVPQVLIDGVPLGSALDLLTLEDDRDLDYMLAREMCPNCLYKRRPDEKSECCETCGAVFREMVTLRFLSAKQVETLMGRNVYNGGRVQAPASFKDKHSIMLSNAVSRTDSLGCHIDIV